MDKNEKFKIYAAHTDQVRASAYGKWLDILPSLAPALTDAVRKVPKHVTDPVNGTKNASGVGDGFRLYKDAHDTGGGHSNISGPFDDGFALLMWVNNWNFPETVEAVGQFLGIPSPRDMIQNASSSTATIKPKIDQAALDEAKEKRRIAEEKAKAAKVKALAYNQALWDQCQPLGMGAPSPIARYLRNRCIELRKSVFGDEIRFHPKLAYYEEQPDGERKLLGEFPAMVAAIKSNDGTVLVLHRTYLNHLGQKAAVSKVKKVTISPGDLPPDAAIRLGGLPTNGILGYAEGIETALSAIKAHGIPVWATYSSSMLQSRMPPPNVHTVVIYADKDVPNIHGKQAGIDAATALKQRLEQLGITVYILLPKQSIPADAKGIDWNDVLIKEGVAGFMPYQQFRYLLGASSFKTNDSTQ